MKSLLIVLSLFMLGIPSMGQSTYDCEELRPQKPLSLNSENANLDSLLQLDLKLIYACLNLDSIDKRILSPQVMSVFMSTFAFHVKNLSYGDVLDSLRNFISTEAYQRGRRGFEFLFEFEDRIVSRADSAEVRTHLTDMLPDEDLDELIAEIYSDQYSNFTYREAISFYLNSNESAKSPAKADSDDDFHILLDHFKDFESLDIIKKRDNRDPVLLYFTGWSVINGRKLEEAFFYDPKVQDILMDYDCFIAYADDRAAISPAQASQFPDLDLRTKGQYIIEVEKMLFQKDYQPLILILNSDLEVLDSYSYKKGNPGFIDFLERNRRNP